MNKTRYFFRYLLQMLVIVAWRKFLSAAVILRPEWTNDSSFQLRTAQVSLVLVCNASTRCLSYSATSITCATTPVATINPIGCPLMLPFLWCPWPMQPLDLTFPGTIIYLALSIYFQNWSKLLNAFTIIKVANKALKVRID